MDTGGSARGKISIYDVAFIVGAMICVGLLAYKAFFSLGYDDESEIILNSLRFVRGDRMLVDDWHVSQLSSFFLYPFILAYHKLTGSAEGIVLFSRVVYVFVKTFVSAAAYITLRPYKKGAVAASLLFLIHEPVWTSLTIYYNTGLLLAGECLSLLLFSLDSGRARLKTYLIGVCCALCVVASPYTAVLFAGYTAAVTAAAVKGRIKKARGADGGKAAGFSLLTAKSWLTVSAGIATVALVFFAYLMRSNSFGEIVKNLPMVFYDDEYTAGVLSGFADLPVNMKRYLLHVASVIPVWASAAGAAVLIAAAVDRGRVRRRIIYIVPMFAVCLFGVVYPYASGDGAAGGSQI